MDSDSSSSASHGTVIRPQAPVPAPRRDRVSRQLTEEDVVDRVLLQSRNDRMYELRRIQHGEKPVTGTDTIQRLEKLLAEEDAPEERRPEAVLVEVHDLSQTRPVHALLQSPAFRQRLEGVIRGSISGSRSPRLVRPTHQVDAAEVQSVASSSSSSSLSRLGAAAPRPRPRGRRPPTSRRFRAELAARLEAGPQTVQPATAQPASLPMPSVPVPQPDPQQSVSGWLESDNREPASRDAHVWGTLEEAYQEELVFEISELVHRQLVTSTLDSDFRGTLEAHMRMRQENSGVDGRRVANFISHLPRGQVLRNDFSHLGLESTPARMADDADSLSFVSAAAVPISHTNAVMSREISSLKSQLKEMKQMMKLTFDLQLDLQRSIRQEVSAALSAATPSGGATSTPPIRTVPFDDSQCLICLDATADSVLYRCGHLCLCYACGMRLQQRGDNCPVCRAPIKDIVRTYRTSLPE